MFLFKRIGKCILSSITIITLFYNANATAEGNAEEMLDNFDTIQDWQTIKAPGTELNLSSEKGVKGKAVCLNYDFAMTKSFVVTSKTIPFVLPQSYEFSFYIKRNMPDNNLEFKLIDDKGNTFWKKWYGFASVNKWKKIVVRKEDIIFAWGPNPEKKLDKVQKIEFAITGGIGKGQVCIDELILTPIPDIGMVKETQSKISEGYYPRWLSEQQAYWTMIGVPEDDKEALLCEDGTIESHKRGFSVMPFLYFDNKLITRNEAKITQGLKKEYLPIPSVTWNYDGIVMNLEMFAYGKQGESVAYARYTITNNRQKDASGKLFLVIQPYQVYPPWQGGGGISLIKNISHQKEGVIIINERDKIYPLTKPYHFGVQMEMDSSPEGNVIDFIKKGVLPKKKDAEDKGGFASAAIAYNFKLKPQQSKDYFVIFPLYDKKPDLNSKIKADELKKIFENRLKEVAAFWEEKVNKVEIDIPETEIVTTLKSNIAYNLITRDGPALQPGSRSYDKAWMRDGGSAANALLEVGLIKEPKDFIDWFADYQLESGEVPPIIDTKAEDPLWEERQNKLVEYDSQGEFIWSILQYYNFTKDKKFLENKLPKVIKALEFLVHLRVRRLTPEYKDAAPEKRIFYGILPESTSHEGYYMKHSYWDDFWALKGWKDARAIATTLGRDDLISWIDKEYADFKESVYNSISLVMKLKNIDYIPGCAELGDYDATSTAVAIVYCDELENLPQPQLKNTFDRFYSELRSRFKPNAEYRFTPYEIRSAPALLYMGEKEKSLELLRFMLKCRRPLAWNHLAEVVHSDYRFPTYIGDMPHTWVGAEYVNAIRSLFVYELDDKLILGHGIDEKWLSRQEGVSVKNMPTYYGTINYTVNKDNDALKIKIWGENVSTPSNGFVFKLPRLGEIKEVNLNGENLTGFLGNEIIFYRLPVEIVVHFK